MKKKVLLVFCLVFCTVFIGLVFAGQAEAVTLTAPNGGEKLLVGSKYNITWTPGSSTMVTLNYSTDSGATWNLIYEGDDYGTFEWTVPNTTTTKARIKVNTMTFAFSGGYIPIPYLIEEEDISDADFTIWKTLGFDFEPLPLVPPAAPTNLVATAASASEVNLAWEDKSNIETGFKIFRKTTSGAFSLIKTLGANSTSYQDTGLDGNTQYIYKVQAYNSIGANDSNEANATTLTAPPHLSPDVSKASNWARTEILQAWEYGLTTPGILSDFQKPITREEFCEIVVLLWEKLSGKSAKPATPNPFTDTNNQEILKAFNLGITKGTSATLFSPGNHITRQEISVMLFRALESAIPVLDTNTTGVPVFADEGQIASWAINEVRFSFKNDIIKGIGNNQIDPLGNTTREQAIVLVKRTHEAFY